MTETAKTAVEQPTTATQPAEQTERQPATGPGLLPFQSQAATAPDNAQWNVANGGRDGQSPIETAIVGNKLYWRTEGGVASKELNQQPRAAAGQSRPGHGLNGMRDLGNGQVAVGQVGGFQNPGYGFVGNREDAERFFQPVGRPGGYNPYRQRFRTLFDEQMDARQRQRERPAMANMPEAPEGGWQTKLGAYKAQLDFLKNQNQAQLGYDTAAADRALQQQQMAQQYGFNMAQLGNDAMRTQAALGVNFLQQQGQQLQNAQSREQMAAYQRWRNAPPGSPEQAQALQEMQMLGGGARGQEREPKRDMLEQPDGTKVPIQYNDDGTYTRLTEAQAGGRNGGANLADELKSFEANLPQIQKDALSKIKNNRERQQRLAMLYMASRGVSFD